MNDKVTNIEEIPQQQGFEEIECAVEFPPAVDWSQTQKVEGRVVRMQKVDIKTPQGPKPTRLLVLSTQDGDRGVWESAGLSEAFNTLQPGDLVAFQQVGERKIPGKPSPMRLFRAWRKPFKA